MGAEEEIKGANKKVPPLQEPDIDDDADSIKEAKDFSSGLSATELEKQANEKKFKRRERFKDHFEWSLLIFLWGITALIAITTLIWTFHLIAPNSWCWLNKEGIERLQTILVSGFGGVLYTIVSKNIKNRID